MLDSLQPPTLFHIYLKNTKTGFSTMRLLFLIFIITGFIGMQTKADTDLKLTLETTAGNIEISLLPELAPNHVARISELAETGFYDGIIFHRVIPGFMAQTGDPDGNGMGGSGQKLKAEFSDYSYREGTVGMARASNPDSADSQFFICYDGCSHLTGQYTVWGQVSDGMDNVYKISAGEPPIEPDRIISASISE